VSYIVQAMSKPKDKVWGVSAESPLDNADFYVIAPTFEEATAKVRKILAKNPFYAVKKLELTGINLLATLEKTPE
jgi:hypothetical protein